MHRDSGLVDGAPREAQGVAVNRWLATDPMGGKHYLETSGGVVRVRAGKVHPWIIQEVQAGREGRIYGWTVKPE